MNMTIEHVKLIYAGKQEVPNAPPLRMWNVMTEGHEYYRSTRTLEGLIELGIVPMKFVRFLKMGRT